jgi:hypothetical protein
MSTGDPQPTTTEEASAIADALQADYFHGYFESQRDALRTELAARVKRLTRCMTLNGDAGKASTIRRSIRAAESELRTIDRILEALDGRFPKS